MRRVTLSILALAEAATQQRDRGPDAGAAIDSQDHISMLRYAPTDAPDKQFRVRISTDGQV